MIKWIQKFRERIEAQKKASRWIALTARAHDSVGGAQEIESATRMLGESAAKAAMRRPVWIIGSGYHQKMHGPALMAILAQDPHAQTLMEWTPQEDFKRRWDMSVCSGECSEKASKALLEMGSKAPASALLWMAARVNADAVELWKRKWEAVSPWLPAPTPAEADAAKLLLTQAKRGYGSKAEPVEEIEPIVSAWLESQALASEARQKKGWASKIPRLGAKRAASPIIKAKGARL